MKVSPAMELCDWNPVAHDFALTTREDGDCENAAVIGLRNGEIHLCEQCAALPEFAKYKKRIKLMPPNAVVNG